jgi:hypothetical protein
VIAIPLQEWYAEKDKPYASLPAIPHTRRASSRRKALPNGATPPASEQSARSALLIGKTLALLETGFRG